MSRTTLLIVPLLLMTPAALNGADGDDRVEFNRHIRPILADKCFRCHGPDAAQREAELRFDDEKSAKRDLGGHFAIKPGKPAESSLIDRITSDDPDERMPPPDSRKSLSAAEIELLRRWIEQGAEFEAHWSRKRLQRPAVPPVKDAKWIQNGVDRFVLAQLERRGIRPSPRAGRVTLLRRLSFDLTGLPPTPEQAKAFNGAKDFDQAYEATVDRLLASPHFGERMAMYWLDLVRYADTVGYHGDQEHAASPYRDWLIDSFNDNKPFDEFTIEQLAGDLLENPTEDQKIATCYNRLLQTTHEGGAQDKEYRAKYAADRVRSFSAVWMGATLGCAECHDHKYDSYSQRNFYQMAAFFADIQERGNYGGAGRAPELEVLSRADRLELKEVEQRIGKREADLKKAQAGDEQTKIREALKRLQDRRKRLQANRRKVMITVSVAPRVVRVLERGDWLDESGEIVEPGTPDSLGELQVDRRATRLDLARWITSPDHPQTARVFVNRIWSLMFGAGLSRSLSDNGSQGDWPSHPDLLDYLARDFVDHRWNVKRTIKSIVMSAAYRQSSLESRKMRELDPENRWLARQSRFRLPAEMIRDNALAVSGLLVRRVGGGVSRPYQPAGYYAFLNFPKRKYQPDANESQYRRGVYMHWQRQFLHPMLRAFDAPTREECTAARPISNTPLAALTLLNDPTFVESARVFAARIVDKGGEGDAWKIAWAWKAAVQRAPVAEELYVCLRLLASARERYEKDSAAAEKLLDVGLAKAPDGVATEELAAWTVVARALLNLSESITRN